MPKPYETHAAIMDCVDTETGEMIDDEKLNALVMERRDKLEGVALWIKNLDSDSAAIRVEREALEKRQKAVENKAASLRRWLAEALDGQKFNTARVAISYRKSVSTEVDSESVAKKWCRKKITYTPDKTAIKEALLSGMKIKGCRLVEKQNIQIK